MMVMMGRNAHFSLHVREVQSAYIRAAGSEFARKPMRRGVRWRVERLVVTSDSRDLATVEARITLHEAGVVSEVAIMVRELIQRLRCF